MNAVEISLSALPISPASRRTGLGTLRRHVNCSGHSHAGDQWPLPFLFSLLPIGSNTAGSNMAGYR